MERTTKALGCIASLAMIAALTVPVAATAYAQPKPRVSFARVDDQDGTNLYDTDQHETQKRQARQVTEQLAQMREADALVAQEAQEAEEARAWSETTNSDAYSALEATETGNLRFNGVESDGVYRYTWYSQRVLPGGGLSIPGRHVDGNGYVVDGDGRICVASSDLPYGTELDTPYGKAVVYDSGCASGTIDVYCNW